MGRSSTAVKPFPLGSTTRYTYREASGSRTADLVAGRQSQGLGDVPFAFIPLMQRLRSSDVRRTVSEYRAHYWGFLR